MRRVARARRSCSSRHSSRRPARSLDLARRRAGAATVPLGAGRVRGRAAPRDRRRRRCRRAGPRACRRHRLVRGRRPAARPRRDDPHARTATPSRSSTSARSRSRKGDVGRRGRRRRHARPERRAGARRPARPPRHPPARTSRRATSTRSACCRSDPRGRPHSRLRRRTRRHRRWCPCPRLRPSRLRRPSAGDGGTGSRTRRGTGQPASAHHRAAVRRGRRGARGAGWAIGRDGGTWRRARHHGRGPAELEGGVGERLRGRPCGPGGRAGHGRDPLGTGPAGATPAARERRRAGGAAGRERRREPPARRANARAERGPQRPAGGARARGGHDAGPRARDSGGRASDALRSSGRRAVAVRRGVTMRRSGQAAHGLQGSGSWSAQAPSRRRSSSAVAAPGSGSPS